MFIFDRFKERCVHKGVKVGYIESRLGVYHGFFNNVRSGKNTISDQIIAQVAVLLDTTIEYLTGKTDDPSIPFDDRTGIKIALFGDIAGGIPRDMIDNFDPDDETSWEEIGRNTARNGTYFALRIKGDSMETRIKDGDRVIVRYQETVESGQTAVVAINGDTATCKKVRWDDHGGVTLVPNNSNYPTSHFTAEQIQQLPVRILGRVVEIRGEP